MKRLIAVTVAAIMSLTLISPCMQAAEWDTSKPPVSVIRQIVPERPSGDDTPWNESRSSSEITDQPSAIFSLDFWTTHMVLKAAIWIVSATSSFADESNESHEKILNPDCAHHGTGH